MHHVEGLAIGHYRVDKQISHGGMSEIYLATDLQTGQSVAMKLVHGSNAEYCQRFQYEIEAMSRLRHNHILPILDYGIQESWCYMITPYIASGTLEQYLQQGPLSMEEAGRILDQLTSALHFIHQQGLVHRDIKPSNVLLERGEHVYLIDFGVAKALDDRKDLTRTGFIIGTAEYIAPELADGKFSPASDIYSLGVLLYRMVAGRTPFQASSSVEIVFQHIAGNPAAPSTFNPALPATVDAVILQALAKEPEQRYQTVTELARAYHNALPLPVSVLDHSFATTAAAEPTLVKQAGSLRIPQDATEQFEPVVPGSPIATRPALEDHWAQGPVRARTPRAQKRGSSPQFLVTLAACVVVFLIGGLVFGGVVFGAFNPASQQDHKAPVNTGVTKPAAPRPPAHPGGNTNNQNTNPNGGQMNNNNNNGTGPIVQPSGGGGGVGAPGSVSGPNIPPGTTPTILNP